MDVFDGLGVILAEGFDSFIPLNAQEVLAPDLREGKERGIGMILATRRLSEKF